MINLENQFEYHVQMYPNQSLRSAARNDNLEVFKEYYVRASTPKERYEGISHAMHMANWKLAENILVNYIKQEEAQYVLALFMCHNNARELVKLTMQKFTFTVTDLKNIIMTQLWRYFWSNDNLHFAPANITGEMFRTVIDQMPEEARADVARVAMYYVASNRKWKLDTDGMQLLHYCHEIGADIESVLYRCGINLN